MEVWLHAFPAAGASAETARRAEEQGYDGLFFADSQNLVSEVWIELALAAAATERIRLGPGVTNPATRHPAVSASAAATLQAESGGRAVLGLGRGDSALGQIGREPVPTAEFERGLAEIQGYLAGESVALENGFESKIGWIAASESPKVPVVVAATGLHVIAAAARHAEGVDFTVGAEPERLLWAVETARAAELAAVAAAEEAAAHAPQGAETLGAKRAAPLSLGAFVNVAVGPDRATARDLVRGSTSILARFATEGAPADGLSEVTRDGIAKLGALYDEARHGQATAPAAQASKTSSCTCRGRIASS